MEKEFIISEILMWYDGPLMVRGMTFQGGQIFALILNEHGKDGNAPWIAAEISQEIMDGVLANKIDLRDVFTKYNIDKAFTGSFEGGVSEFATLKPIEGEIPNEWLPESDCFLCPKCWPEE